MSSWKFVGIIALAVASGYGLARQGGLKQEEPPYRGLDANLYMQISAEYRALCFQTYALATLRLKEKLPDALIESTLVGKKDKLPAVILDLDETVLDNRGYQSTVMRDLGGGFHPTLWTKWESDEHSSQVPLVPGAREFLDVCKKCQVAVVFISNRTEGQRVGTKAVLSKLGIDLPEDQLLLNDSAISSDKTARRAKVLNKFNVILQLGDNLRDFDESYKYDKLVGSDGRKAIVDRERSKFGTEWIILPNPAYGEWAKAGGNGLKDLELLSPSVNLKP